MQATNAFMAANNTVLNNINVQNPLTGHMVNGAELLPAWQNPGACPDETEVLFETDCDDLAQAPAGNAAVACNAPVHAVPVHRQDFVNALVEQIHNCPHVPMYRGRPKGPPALGWPNRLRSYYWPTAVPLPPILAEANRLAAAANAGPWLPMDQDASVDLANQIFAWGHVRQAAANVTPDAVRSVFDAVISAIMPAAGPMPPMNSGWTKVAAFASALTCRNQLSCNDVSSQADVGMLGRISRGRNRPHDA
jgi:hypothetical protein